MIQNGDRSTDQIEFNFNRAIAARDEGIGAVVANGRNWHNLALRVIASLPAGWVGISEELRPLILASEAGAPHSPTAWGALTNHAKRDGLLVPTGVRRPMSSVKSHGRATDEYRRTTKGAL